MDGDSGAREVFVPPAAGGTAISRGMSRVQSDCRVPKGYITCAVSSAVNTMTGAACITVVAPFSATWMIAGPKPTLACAESTASRVPVSPMNVASNESSHLRSTCSESRSGSTETKITSTFDRSVGVILPSTAARLAICTGHTSGQLVKPNSRKVSRPAVRAAKSKALPSVSVSVNAGRATAMSVAPDSGGTIRAPSPGAQATTDRNSRKPGRRMGINLPDACTGEGRERIYLPR